MADPLLGPQAAHQPDRLDKPRRALGERNAEGFELGRAVAEPDAEDEVAARQHVERRGLLGDVHRIERRQDQMFGPIVMPCACAAI